MMPGMRQRLLYIVWTIGLVLLTPVLALAQKGGSDEEKGSSAKYLGYKVKVVTDDRSMTLVWLMFVLLTIICIAALFKNAKRTHLD